MKLDPRLYAALEARGLAEPTPAQSAAWPPIAAGKHTLLIAPTGVGKTEAAVVPLLDGMLREPTQPISVLYITPLRSLNRDMLRRLQGFGEELQIPVAVRHGDTSQKERNRQSRHPAQLLVTTPETLQIMLSGKRLRTYLTQVRAVVIDEVHELASSERGAQLSLALERLALLAGEFQRIGLSATVGTPGEVAGFLGGDRTVEIIAPAIVRKMDLQVVSPQPDDADETLSAELYWEPQRIAALRYCAEAAAGRPTLLFVNTRDTSEALGVRWRMWQPDAAITVHHGSLSRDVRIEAEEGYRTGDISTLICTSSLELGIDVGNTELVLQYNSPRDPSRLSQRLGRSGHRLRATAIGRVVASEPVELLEAAVVARRTLAGELEPSRIREAPLAVLANQLIAWTVCDKSVDRQAMLGAARRAWPFRELRGAQLDELLALLDQLHQARPAERNVRQGPRALKYFHGNLSLIPDEKTMSVRDISTRRLIGRLDERFILNLASGERIIFRGAAWEVLEIEEEVMVAPASALGELPRWIGEDIPVPQSVAREAVQRLEAGDWEGLPLTPEAREALEEFRTSVFKDGEPPAPGRMTLERHERLLVLTHAGGTRLNRTLGMVLASLLTSRAGEACGFQSDPYRIILDLPARLRARDVEQTVRALRPGLGPLLRLAVRGSPALGPQLLHVARKMGAIAPDADVGRFGLRRLLAAYSDTPLYREAVERLLFHQLDEPGLEALATALADGKLEIVASAATPFGAGALEPYRDLLKPPRPGSAILAAVERRLRRTVLRLECLACDNSRRRRSSDITVGELRCPKCSGQMVALLHPLEVERGVPLRQRERSASLARTHGPRAALVLAGRGVGPATAGRILRRQLPDDQLVQAVMEAEITYARTRRFWD
ncbi:MAG: DEAD/DEAH box helicase [Candidatus Poseidoniia archaeon]|jgi:ATP-dependent Lhr-like helicase|nr:DEAD/DEAH box helicase [Candidatus Poseidoniia archaeon]